MLPTVEHRTSCFGILIVAETRGQIVALHSGAASGTAATVGVPWPDAGSCSGVAEAGSGSRPMARRPASVTRKPAARPGSGYHSASGSASVRSTQPALSRARATAPQATRGSLAGSTASRTTATWPCVSPFPDQYPYSRYRPICRPKRSAYTGESRFPRSSRVSSAIATRPCAVQAAAQSGRVPPQSSNHVLYIQRRPYNVAAQWLS
jgi:hypothetical protein